MASARVVETSVANNSPSQASNRPDGHFQSRYVTPGFKPFSYLIILFLNMKQWRQHFPIVKRNSTNKAENINIKKSATTWFTVWTTWANDKWIIAVRIL